MVPSVALAGDAGCLGYIRQQEGRQERLPDARSEPEQRDGKAEGEESDRLGNQGAQAEAESSKPPLAGNEVTTDLGQGHQVKTLKLLLGIRPQWHNPIL